MKKIITVFCFAFCSTAAFSQQDPQFSQYMNNKLFMNPAYAGMRQALCVTTLGRQQWAGFDGSPKSLVFSADYFAPAIKGGIGINILSDKLGFESNLAYRLNYSFHLPLGGGVLGIGLELGAMSKRLGPTGTASWLATSTWQNDQAIPPQLKQTIFDFGFGLWYQRQNLWCGLSSTHLPAGTMSGNSSAIGFPPVSFPLTYQIARHYFITGGYNWNINGGDWELRPSFLAKSDATITSVDLNVTALFNQRFWVGASYRFQDAIVPMVGFMLPNSKATSNEMPGGGLKIGFAYDYTTSNLKSYNSGSFELMLNYCMPIVIPPRRQGHGDVRIFD